MRCGLAVLLALALLAGCTPARDPVPAQPVVIEIPGETKYVSVDAEHLVPCTIPDRRPLTVGDLYAIRIDLREALKVCDSQIQAIRERMESGSTN